MDIDNIINGMVEASAIRSGINDLLEYIRDTIKWDEKECGNCTYWMCKNLCPQEKRINGRPKGPSMSHWGCEKFEVKGYCTTQKQERIKKINENQYLKYINRKWLVNNGIVKVPTECISCV